MDTEKVYRYPRLFTGVVEALSTIAAVGVVAWLGCGILNLLWRAFGLDTALFERAPLLAQLVETIERIAPVPTTGDLLPFLGWTALVLFLVLMIRNSLPAVRTSPRGMLVEFAGDWLPIPWESVQVIKVTEANERYVLLAETQRGVLTGWHRFYSLIYRFGFSPGFLVTSAISDFDDLVRTLLSETDRVARVVDNARPAQLREDAMSPFFRLLLSPSGFFAQRSEPPVAAQEAAAVAASGAVVRGNYPGRILALTRGTAITLFALTMLRYLLLWMTFLALTFPQLRNLPLFNMLDLRLLPAPWWPLVGAHLLLLIMLPVCAALYNLLPDLEARADGLAVRYFKRWAVVPWARIRAVKVTELTERSQVVLIQGDRGLPLIARLSSLIYDGSLRPGLLVTSAISSFEPLLQRAILEVMRNPAEEAVSDEAPVFQSEARSDALLLSFQSSSAIDKLVEDARADDQITAWNMRRLLGAAPPMVWVALLPALILLADRIILQGVIPDGRMIAVALVMFILGLLEWPLVAIATIVLDEMSGGGEEGNRAFYLYPLTQLPRLLPLGGALALVLVGVPFLPSLLWIGAIVWSFLLAAGLWGALYDWRGGQLLAGGLIPVLYQLLILIGYLVVRA
jgi:hypothetical protein